MRHRVLATFHGHGEGVRGGAVAVGRSALVLAVVLQRDAAEVEPAFVVLRPAAGFLQAAVLLLPIQPGGRPAGTARTSAQTGSCTDDRLMV